VRTNNIVRTTASGFTILESQCLFKGDFRPRDFALVLFAVVLNDDPGAVTVKSRPGHGLIRWLLELDIGGGHIR